jgi:hypothetical protein
MKAAESKHFNDKLLLQKDKSKQVMTEQKKIYEKSLLDKVHQEIEFENQ